MSRDQRLRHSPRVSANPYGYLFTLAQGRPDDPAPPEVTTVRFLPMHTGRGCELSTRSSLRPLISEGLRYVGLGRFSRRDNLARCPIRAGRRPGTRIHVTFHSAKLNTSRAK